MIGRLRGELVEVESGVALIDVGGVGYEVSVPESVLVELAAPGNEVQVLIRQIFREDGVSLYGFATAFQRRLFDLLMTVKGCGPKVGLSLLTIGEEIVASSILAQDARSLSRATGVGPRLAERIILELKEKIAEETFQRKVLVAVADRRAQASPKDELVDALLALGYRRQEAEIAANEARSQADTVQDQLRIALRELAR